MTAPPLAEDDNLRDKAFRSVGWVVLEKWSVRLVSLGVFAILWPRQRPSSAAGPSHLRVAFAPMPGGAMFGVGVGLR